MGAGTPVRTDGNRIAFIRAIIAQVAPTVQEKAVTGDDTAIRDQIVLSPCRQAEETEQEREHQGT